MSINKTIIVSNIQRFSLHDGPGIRTTVFLKGCNLHCPWCSNPENINKTIENYVKEDGREGFYGKYVSCDDIWSEIIKDRIYYANDGGVTYSGGEPLLWMEQMNPILKRCNEESIHQCIETSLFAPQHMMDLAMKHIDLFIVDMKIMEQQNCLNVLGGNLIAYKENLLTLEKSGIPYMLRIPLIEPFTTNENNIKCICQFIAGNYISPIKIELLKGHNLAEKKYKSLQRQMYYAPDLSEGLADSIAKRFDLLGVCAEICSI